MYISGDNIDTYRVRVKPDFRPDTKLALNWFKLSDGNYTATDRGSSSDVYESKFRLYAKEDEVHDFMQEVYDNRTDDANYFQLSGFEETEHIFGEDLDYSVPVDVTVLNMSPIKQGSFKGFGMEVNARALSPTFSYASVLPDIKFVEIGYRENPINTIIKYDSYNGSYAYLDKEYDSGEFTFICKFCGYHMGQMRRYLATQRSDNFNITQIDGVSYPFGPYRNHTFPMNVKVVDWEDLGMWGVSDWRMKLTFAEVI